MHISVECLAIYRKSKAMHNNAPSIFNCELAVECKLSVDFPFVYWLCNNASHFKPCSDKKPQGSLVTADEIFDNGRIRPILPVFDDESLLFTATPHGNAALKKLFVEQRRSIFPYNSESQNTPKASPFELPRKTAPLEAAVEDSKDVCKKSNSTGFSKLWRFRRDLKLRSNSEGRDAFVFLNPLTPSNSEKKVKNVVLKKEKPKTTSSLSAHEKLYVMNRKRNESDKRRSFLPYKQQLGGFFANVNGFSRNLHPF